LRWPAEPAATLSGAEPREVVVESSPEVVAGGQPEVAVRADQKGDLVAAGDAVSIG